MEECSSTKSAQQPCLMILNCFKNADKRLRQNADWTAQLPFPRWFHVLGDPTLPQSFEFDDKEHTLTVRTRDDYAFLPSKSHAALAALHVRYPEASHVMKTDDDMSCNVSALMSICDRLVHRDIDYAGFMVQCGTHMSSYHYPYVDAKDRVPLAVHAGPYASGRFYALSKRAIAHIVDSTATFQKPGFEDNCVGSAVQTMTPRATYLELPAVTVFSEYKL